ncbi:IS3 family transposase, partial [Paraburkholderia fynbosensis]|uniref:IS3 family transposase n=1 Tax=Paraburkholderia fynbosensis TaxID=1200993 RepID=UPI0015832734
QLDHLRPKFRRVRGTMLAHNRHLLLQRIDVRFSGSTSLVYHRKFSTRDQACKQITEYIEIFYNRQRTQERLDYLSPAAFTQRFHSSKIAA